MSPLLDLWLRIRGPEAKGWSIELPSTEPDEVQWEPVGSAPTPAEALGSSMAVHLTTDSTCAILEHDLGDSRSEGSKRTEPGEASEARPEDEAPEDSPPSEEPTR